MTNLFDLSNKVTIVTGGNSGIGLGMARGLASAGAKVLIAARDEVKSAAAVQELKELGAGALTIACDVTDGASTGIILRASLLRTSVKSVGLRSRLRPHQKPAIAIVELFGSLRRSRKRHSTTPVHVSAAP